MVHKYDTSNTNKIVNQILSCGLPQYIMFELNNFFNNKSYHETEYDDEDSGTETITIYDEGDIKYKYLPDYLEIEDSNENLVRIKYNSITDIR